MIYRLMNSAGEVWYIKAAKCFTIRKARSHYLGQYYSSPKTKVLHPVTSVEFVGDVDD